MPSVGQVANAASLPASVALKLAGLSNPVTAAISAGLTLVQLVDKIGQGRKAANKFTQNGGPQDIINKQLAAISGSGASAEEMAQATDKAWRDFLGASNEFAAANPKQSAVVRQAIYNTPKLTQTVQTLLGGQDPLDEAYTSAASSGIATGLTRPNPGPSVLGTVAKAGLAAATPFLMSKIQTGSWNPSGATTVGKVAGGLGASIDPNTGLPLATAGTAVGGTMAKAPGLGSKVLSAVLGGDTGGNTANSSLLSRILPTAISSGTSLLSGVLGSRAASKAAGVQVDADLEAARLAAQTGAASLQFNRDALAQQQRNQQPWIDAGGGALRTIGSITSDPGFSWNRTFTAPTEDEAMQDPGIQFQLKQGQRALEAYERANGTLLSGKAAKEINEFAQGVASTGYDKVFGRKLTGFNTDYNTFANERAAKLNPQLALAGLGQTSTAQLNTDVGQNANANATIGMTTAGQVANQTTAAANSRASGYIGGANSWLSSLGQIGNNLMSAQTIQQLMQRLQPQAAA